MTTITNNKLTAERLVTLQLRLMSALSFYRQRPEREAKNMADLLMLCGAAASELQERRKAVEDNDLLGVIDALEHPAGINAAGRRLPTANPDEYACCIAADMWNACRAATLQGSQPVSNHDELPYAQVKAVADLYALCWQSGEVVTYTPDQEKATIWLNNYSGTCVQEYVKLERLQEALAGNSPVIPEG
ncbi:prophage protein [Salmonella enterica]|uniref:Prophage protein n=1 Tax=Salmonella enterica TaxID=28901 RepID=A0A379QLX8_SALER|nr:Eaa protein [Salmonella enterica]SUF57544.1 prophage protein [Salmonella enterica]